MDGLKPNFRRPEVFLPLGRNMICTAPTANRI
jgi:hypothetical protein